MHEFIGMPILTHLHTRTCLNMRKHSHAHKWILRACMTGFVLLDRLSSCNKCHLARGRIYKDGLWGILEYLEVKTDSNCSQCNETNEQQATQHPMITALCAVMRCGWHAHASLLRFCQSHLFPILFYLLFLCSCIPILFFCFFLSFVVFNFASIFYVCFQVLLVSKHTTKWTRGDIAGKIRHQQNDGNNIKGIGKQAHNRREAALHTHACIHTFTFIGDIMQTQVTKVVSKCKVQGRDEMLAAFSVSAALSYTHKY